MANSSRSEDERPSQSHRLGYGEFAASGERSMALWDARRIFFEKVEDLASEVLSSLRTMFSPIIANPPNS